MTIIYDLDHTIIDSSHRQLTKPDGTLDLENWVENCTREKILADTLLPLADSWLAHLDSGENPEIVVCTARVMGTWDYTFLGNNGLFATAILSRPEGCILGDADLKEFLLRQYAMTTNRTWARFANGSTMYDDNIAVLTRCETLGICVKDAVLLNQKWERTA
jgi:hypothetical protein